MVLPPLRGAEDELTWLMSLRIEQLVKLQRAACEAQEDVPTGPGAPMLPWPTVLCFVKQACMSAR